MAETQTVVTARVGMTTDHQISRVVVVLMRPLTIILVRAGRVYLQVLLGLFGALGTGVAATVGVSMTATGFFHLLKACSGIALVPAAISVLQNMLELLVKLDASHPEWRG